MLSRSPVTSRRPAGFIDPCLPTLARAVPDGPLWVHEIKHDGYRFIRRRDGDRVRLFTRRGHDWTDRVPAIAESLRSVRTLPGPVPLCTSHGRATRLAFDPAAMQGRMLSRSPLTARRPAGFIEPGSSRVLWSPGFTADEQDGG